ncbi:hypothetical protein AJ79_04430 [Helicocarpus griseus UAMH5409]|uniref:Aminoglycoside phosphotransferase domain-containing protein n=1 Tax=Helicocarpus griseus UAMH5409 TaxID=1447875 RepID=A0A2B7XTE1_9EURO|nr:hypothetical protein AJ79_04430 [Helicocarpus griseus UAMH5409]
MTRSCANENANTWSCEDVQAVKFVRENSTIPVPDVLEVHISGPDSWFRMERLPGTQLGEAWARMDERAQVVTTGQLKLYLKQLRELPVPSTASIGSLSSGSAYDHRLNNGFPCGPFASVAEFHDFLVAPVLRSPRPEWSGEYCRLLNDNYMIQFAHADLSFENILVNEHTGKVTAILDWEMAGFWPEWWEFLKALYGGRSLPWWFAVVKNTMPCYNQELEVECDLEMF